MASRFAHLEFELKRYTDDGESVLQSLRFDHTAFTKDAERIPWAQITIHGDAPTDSQLKAIADIYSMLQKLVNES